MNAAVLVECGVLPDAGGWQDQALTFVLAWPLIMTEVQHWRNVAVEKAREKAARKKGR